ERPHDGDSRAAGSRGAARRGGFRQPFGRGDDLGGNASGRDRRRSLDPDAEAGRRDHAARRFQQGGPQRSDRRGDRAGHRGDSRRDPQAHAAKTLMRPSKRKPDDLRPIAIERHYTRHAEGSVLVAFGDTRGTWTPSVQGVLPASPIRDFVAAVSVGLFEGVPILDLDYAEDSDCETDMNVVMTGSGGFVEVQGTAEGEPFSAAQMDALLALAMQGIAELIAKQKAALGLS